MTPLPRVVQGGALALLCLGMLSEPSLVAQDEGEPSNQGCYSCHVDSDETMEFEDEIERSIDVDKRAFLESAHGKLACTACHVGLDPMEHMDEDRGPYSEYLQGMVARCDACHTGTAEDVDPALLPSKTVQSHMHPAGVEGTPLCVDCHSAHAVPREAQLSAVASRGCADCHEETYAEFAGSVHGKALTDPDHAASPACVDCHSGHEEGGRSFAAHGVRLGQPCMGCHGDAERMEPFGLSTKVVSTYLNDFHGTSVRFYGEEAKDAGLPTLVCADCHGIHDVVTMRDGGAEEMKANLVQVCQKCHTDVSASFPDAWLSHYEPSLTKAPLVFLVRLAYMVFIPFVIVGLLLHIFAHLVLLPRRRRRDKMEHPHAKTDPADKIRMVTRFSRWRRTEHMLVMLTFVLLLLTGLPQKFWGQDWAVFISGMFGGIDTMRTVHRVTGIVFSGLCVIHLSMAVGGVIAGRFPPSMVPEKKDFRDAIVSLRYFAGTTHEEPKFDRYEYRQKFEYWGMIVGSLVMIVSGFVLYFPMIFATYLPGQFIPAAKEAHTWEAMMALLTILIWHLYGAHLNPDCYPMDKAIFTGKISVARMKHEHGLEWEREKDELEKDES